MVKARVKIHVRRPACLNRRWIRQNISNGLGCHDARRRCLTPDIPTITNRGSHRTHHCGADEQYLQYECEIYDQKWLHSHLLSQHYEYIQHTEQHKYSVQSRCLWGMVSPSQEIMEDTTGYECNKHQAPYSNHEKNHHHIFYGKDRRHQPTQY